MDHISSIQSTVPSSCTKEMYHSSDFKIKQITVKSDIDITSTIHIQLFLCTKRKHVKVTTL